MLEKLFQNLMSAFVRKKMIYLDHAATTPLDSRVQAVMVRTMSEQYANPGAIHSAGIAVRLVINDARRTVAKLLGTTSDHIIFTRGGTESNHLAIRGVIARAQELMGDVRPHVISSVIEHAAVLETLRALEQQKVIELTLVEVTPDGIVDMGELKKALRPETVLVSVMYVNNEIGTIQPIREIAKLIRWYRKQLGRNLVATTKKTAEEGSVGKTYDLYPVFHVDAIQAVNYLDIHVERLGVDLMSLSGSKIYAPKSSGVLFVRNRALLAPVMVGGDQEFGLRPGTEDIVQVVGFTEALTQARTIAEQESERLTKLRDSAIAALKKNIPDMVINGSHKDRIANNISCTIPGISGERLVIELDARGILCASKSACKEDSDEASHVLTALHRAATAKLAEGSELVRVGRSTGKHLQFSDTDGAVRFTLGRETTAGDMRHMVTELTDIVHAIRAFEKTISRK